MHDFRFALRQLVKSPSFTAVIVLSLALGIGSTTTVLCWIENLLLRPIPGAAAQHELVVVTTSHGERMWDTVSLPDLRDVAALTDVFQGVIGSQQTPASFTFEEESEWLYGQIVTANFFEVLGVRPVLGRTFLAEEDLKPGGHPVLVIGENFWRRRFDADPSVIGRVVDLNRHSFTIVGVAPAAFRGDVTGLACEFWAPTMMHREVAYSGIDANQILQRYARWHHTLARLQPGVSIAQAQSVLATLARRLEETYPETNRNIRLHLHALWNSTYGAPRIFRPVLSLLLAVSLGVLLIVTANVANLLLARATGRQKEIAIRLALGAGRSRLVRQLLVESLVLALCGGVLGVLLAHWMVDLFALFVPPTHLPVRLDAPINGRTLAAALVVTLVAGLAFGLVPAWRASRPNLNDSLKAGGRSSGGAEHHRARHALVVTEIALALVLLVGAGLCLRGLQRARQLDAGLDANGVLLAGLRVGMNGYTRETAPAFYRTLRQRLMEAPGVQSVALANWFPLGFEDTGTNAVEIPGRPRRMGDELNFRLAIVSPDYFTTLGIPLLAGRDFTDRDDDAAERVAIINQAMAQRFWPGQEAVGRTFKNNGRDTTIIGVAKTGKYRGLSDAPECFFYLPCTQATWALDLGVAVRGHGGNAEALIPVLRRELQSIDPGVQIWQSLPLAAYIAAASVPQQIASSLLSLLGGVALALAGMGVYAIMSYAVGQRTQEFGVRLALGARPADLVADVVRRGLALAGVGSVIGLACALAVTRLLSGFLFGVSPFDAATFLIVPLVLVLTALLACYLPALRATRVNPLTALRAE